MKKSMSYWIAYVGIAMGITGAVGISYYRNQRKFVKVPIIRKKQEILERTEPVSAKLSNVEEFVERRRQRAAEKRKKRMG